MRTPAPGIRRINRYNFALSCRESRGLSGPPGVNTMDLGGFSLAWLRDLAFCAALEAERDSW
jgi:hypothetical protein